MKFVLASSNQHKADEIIACLPPLIQLVLQGDLGVDSPPETGTTFIENAIIKAQHASRKTGLPAIADDSGLCVQSLGGAPGIYSARYASNGNDQPTDEANTAKLLTELEGATDRRAFFYCVLVCISSESDPTPLIAEAKWQGEVANQASGEAGFGYDPVFFLPESGRTAAELSPAEKNSISHRGQALKKLAGILRERYPD